MAHLVPKLQPFDIPHCDAFFPQIISDDEGFVKGDVIAGAQLGDPQPAISITGLRHLAKRYAQMYTAEDYAEAKDATARAEDRIAELEEELADADSVLEGVDVLAKKGYLAKRVAGRKLQKKAPQAQEAE